MSGEATVESYLDLESVSALQEIMEDDYSDIVLLFIETAPGQIELLKKHHAESDLQQLGAVAHTIKGSSGNIGASSLFHVCEKLENGLRNNSIGDPLPHIEKIEEIYLATQDEFKKLLSKGT